MLGRAKVMTSKVGFGFSAQARPGAGGPLLVRVDQENLEALLGEAGGDIDR